MPIWVQNIIVLALVMVCCAVVAWQAFQSLQGKKSPVGRCCSRGCQPESKHELERVVFVPIETLNRRRNS